MSRRLRCVLRSWWTIGLCSAVAAALMAAFVCGPATMLRPDFPDYADIDRMPAAVTPALNAFLGTGAATLPAELARLAQYWCQWHAIKVAICVPMLAAFGIIAAACWTRGADSTGRRATLFNLAANCAAVFAVLAAWLLAINVQATAVPLVALLPLVSTGGLTPPPRAVTSVQTPAVTELLAQVSSYHWILALGATVLATLSIAAAATSWHGRIGARVTGRPTIMYTTLLTLMSLNAIAGVLLAAYSATSAMDPAGSLDAILGIS